jgi:hypothetical protein
MAATASCNRGDAPRPLASHAESKDDEFIASVPDTRVVRPGGLLRILATLLQRTIAGKMPVLVVDDLEVVEIQQHQRELSGARGRGPVPAPPGNCSARGLASPVRPSLKCQFLDAGVEQERM